MPGELHRPNSTAQEKNDKTKQKRKNVRQKEKWRIHREMATLPPLEFPGHVLLVTTLAQDQEAWKYIQEEAISVVGVDFEWQPDLQPGSNNPLALAQVCCEDRCYIWCLYLFLKPPTGLEALLRNESVLKVVCGPSNDFKKLKTSGFNIGQIGRRTPKYFVDIQQYPVDPNEPKSIALDVRTMTFLGHRLDKYSIKWSTVNWSQIQQERKMLDYAVNDAYACLRIYHANEDRARRRQEHRHAAEVLAMTGTIKFIADQLQFNNEKEYRDLFAPGMLQEMEYQKQECERITYTVRVERRPNRTVILVPIEESATEVFASGSRLLLYENLPRVDSESYFEFRVIYYEETDEHIIDEEFGLLEGIQEGRRYYMKQSFNSVPFRRSMHALQNWTTGLNELVRRIILGSPEIVQPTQYQILPQLPNKIHGHALNQSQMNAIKFSIQRPFSLIHGPPGTGKTHTLAAIVHFLVRNTKEDRILVCAPSNEASDNLAEMIIKSGIQDRHELVIIKSQMRRHLRVRNTLTPFLAHSLVPDNQAVPGFDRVSQCRIVVCTLSMAGSKYLVNQNFRYVLVDEASQCVEAETLIAIAHSAQNVTLAGDHKQLRPVVMNKRLVNSAFERSLFERLMTTQKANSFQLSIQYRMHPAISIWPSREFYDGTLIDGVTKQDRALPIPFEGLIPLVKGQTCPEPNFLVHVKGETSPAGRAQSSSVNLEEARLALAFYLHLRRAFGNDTSIVILTPYTGQVLAIQDMLEKAHVPKAPRSVFSITEFQGREADIVIVSTVRASKIAGNTTATLGFTAEPQRTNVALTRAKRGQIVLGDLAILQTNPFWKSAIAHYASVGTLFEVSIPAKAPTGLPVLTTLDPASVPAYVPLPIPTSTFQVYINGFPFSYKDDQLLAIFRDYNANSSRVVRMTNGRSRGYGFVGFANKADLKASLALDQTQLVVPGRAQPLLLTVQLSSERAKTNNPHSAKKTNVAKVCSSASPSPMLSLEEAKKAAQKTAKKSKRAAKRATAGQHGNNVSSANLKK